MTLEEFLKEVKKVNSKREHKVKNSVGVYDIYKHIRKNKWYNIGRPLKEKEFYKIIRSVNLLLAKSLVGGAAIKLPHKMGTIEIRKRPSRIQIVNGKLVTNLPIDWKSTLKLWYEDEEAYNNKTLVRLEKEELYQVYYNKKDAEYNNLSFFEFKPNRVIKVNINRALERGVLDAYLIGRYG